MGPQIPPLLLALRQHRIASGTHTILSWIIFSVFLVPTASLATLIKLPDCEFSVEVPNAKRVTQLHSQDYSYHQVRGRTKQVFYQAECVPGVMDGDGALIAARAHTKSIAGYGMQFKKINAKVFENRFVKDIKGAPITYVARYYLGVRSTLVIVAGTESKNYPSSEILEFFKSVNHQE